jgi:nucleotidyltransferase/DNA polymerase involved in DNA repair
MEQKTPKKDNKPIKKVGRKPINIDIDKVESLASQNMGVMEICRSLGVGWDTFNKNRKRKTELSEAYERGRAKGLERATFRLMEQIDEGNFQAIQFYLKNTDSDKWKDRQEVVNATINLNDVLSGAKDRLHGYNTDRLKAKEINPLPTTSKDKSSLVINQTNKKKNK